MQNNQIKTDDGLCTYILPDSEPRKEFNKQFPVLVDRFSNILEEIAKQAIQGLKQTYSSKFFEEINKAVETYNWVDIEAVYYRWLTKIFKQGECEYADSHKLNNELKILKENLVRYLTDIQTQFIKPELEIKYI